MTNSKSGAIFASASSAHLHVGEKPLRNREMTRTQAVAVSASAYRQPTSFASVRRRKPALRRRNADAEISIAASAPKCIKGKCFYASRVAADDADTNFRALFQECRP